MTKKEFITGYVTAFLGSWASELYESPRPNWQTAILNPPIEDAIFQAEQTWERCRELNPNLFEECSNANA